MSDGPGEKTVIDGLLQRYGELRTFLQERGEVSLSIETEANFKKLLIMACGSYFEEQITSAIDRFATSIGEARLASFIRNKALERQYHTFFDWKTVKNVNSFLVLFGQHFKDTVGAAIGADDDLVAGMRAFLELGQQRNLLAHGNLGAMSTPKTLDEIEGQYRRAHTFVRFLIGHFAEA